MNNEFVVVAIEIGGWSAAETDSMRISVDPSMMVLQRYDDHAIELPTAMWDDIDAAVRRAKRHLSLASQAIEASS